MDTALKKGHLSFAVLGNKLKGSFALQRISKPGDKPQWLLMKKVDSYSTEKEILETHPLSVKSKQDFVGILKRDFPKSWLEKPPAVGGQTGAIFRKIIDSVRKSRTKKHSS